MYSEKDYRDAKTGLRNFILLYCLMAAILIGLVVADQFWRTNWLSYASASLLAIASLFLWGNFGVRLVCWNRFLKEMEIANISLTEDELRTFVSELKSADEQQINAPQMGM